VRRRRTKYLSLVLCLFTLEAARARALKIPFMELTCAADIPFLERYRHICQALSIYGHTLCQAIFFRRSIALLFSSTFVKENDQRGKIYNYIVNSLSILA